MLIQVLAVSFIFANLSSEQKEISKISFDKAMTYISQAADVPFDELGPIKIYVYVNPMERDIAYFGYQAMACVHLNDQGQMIGGDIVFQSNDALADVNIVQHELSHFLGLKNNPGKTGIMSARAVGRAKGKPMRYSRQELAELKRIKTDLSNQCSFCFP